jgi:hypothetical protein
MKLFLSLPIILFSTITTARALNDNTTLVETRDPSPVKSDDKMYEFLDRLVSVALPRVRDFRGLGHKKCFDGHGNYNIGVHEQIVFPEIDYDAVELEKMGGRVHVGTTEVEAAEIKALMGQFCKHWKKKE